MYKVKICGITNLKEIDILNELHIDYAGFVFAESKRKVDIDKARSLLKNLDSNIKSVAVFRNNSLNMINDVIKSCNFDVAQLHGSEDINFIKQLKKDIDSNIEIWKALSIKDSDSLNFYLNNNELIDKFIIDGDDPGSGNDYPLKKLKDILDKSKVKVPVIIAGGITPENVFEKINYIKPYGVDVSSGVEDINNDFRIKSYKKIEKLLNEVNR